MTSEPAIRIALPEHPPTPGDLVQVRSRRWLVEEVVDPSVAWAVFAGFTLGKPVGIVAFGWLAVRAGLASRPPDIDWTMLVGGGLLAGIGFTMALFIADLAFDDALIDAAKLGILCASLVAAAGGLAVLAWATRGRG